MHSVFGFPSDARPGYRLAPSHGLFLIHTAISSKEMASFGEGVDRPPRTRPLAEDISIAIDTTTGMICIWDLVVGIQGFSGAHVIKMLQLAGFVLIFLGHNPGMGTIGMCGRGGHFGGLERGLGEG